MSRDDTFRRMPWSVSHCWSAIAVVAVIIGVFHVLAFFTHRGLFYPGYLSLWLLMFAWMTFFPLWIVRRKRMLHRPAIGRVAKEIAIAIPVVICLVIAEALVQYGLTYLPGGGVQVGSAFSWIRRAPNDHRLYLILVTAFTLAPVGEELLFRGLLYNALRQRAIPVVAVCLQALLFALAHYHFPHTRVPDMLYVFIFGVLLVGIYEWRKTIWAPISLHVLHNLIFAVLIIVLLALNHHIPAGTWEDAQRVPAWLQTDTIPIERKSTGQEQRLHAINTWGSKGSRLWKKELRAFETVCEWFPQDRTACAKARLGIAEIYLVYLRDFRRSVVECDRILSNFKDQPQVCAEALVKRGWAYYELRDYKRSRQSFEAVLDSYPSCDRMEEEASEGLRVLETGR